MKRFLYEQLADFFAPIVFDPRPTYIKIIFSKILDVNPVIHAEGLTLLRRIQTPYDYPLLKWLKQHDYKHAMILHKQLLYEPIRNHLIQSALKRKPVPWTCDFHSPELNQLYSQLNPGLSLFTFHYTQYIPNHFEPIIWDYLEQRLLLISHARNDPDVFSLDAFFNFDKVAKKQFLHKCKTTVDYSSAEFKLDFKNTQASFQFFHRYFKDKSKSILLHMTQFIKPESFIDMLVITYKKGDFHYLTPYFFNQLSKLTFASAVVTRNIMENMMLFLHAAQKEQHNPALSASDYKITPILFQLMPLFYTSTDDDELLSQMMKIMVINYYKNNLNISSEVLIDQNASYTIIELFMLMKAHMGMRDNDYIDIFDVLLKRQIHHQGIGNYLWNPVQNETIGKAIASHNIITNALFKEAGIDDDFVFNYPHERIFSVFGSKILERNQHMVTLWQLFLSLSEQLELALTPDNNQRALQKQLNNYIGQINKKNHGRIVNKCDLTLFNYMTNNANMQLLCGKIKPLLTKIPPCDLRDQLLRVINSLALLHEEYKNHSTLDNNWKTPHHYSVQVWDKTRPDTFFLGNFLGCCLATNGIYFKAIIQRIIDHGMMIVTVVDEATQQPVAGIWLYVAYDRLTKRNLLVANFTEMRASIGIHHAALREAILVELLTFTNELATQMGVHLILAPQNYGCLPPWQFPTVNLSVEKIGFMALQDHEPFYLKSLFSNHFHVFNPHLLSTLYPQAADNISESCTRNTHSKKIIPPLPLKPFSFFQSFDPVDTNNREVQQVRGKLERNSIPFK